MRIEQKVENFIQRLPWRKRNQELLIDLIDTCPGACPTCSVALDPRRDGHKMDIHTFRRILDKAQSECNLWKAQLYRFSDPLMHPDIHLFIEECYRRGIPSSTSSFLQTSRCNWDKLAASHVTEFRVSFSGWKGIHKYQYPATPGRFLKTFEMASKLPWSSDTLKVFFFHIYKDNKDEIEPARHLAESHGFKFISFPTTFMAYDRILNGYTEQDRETLSWMDETPEQNIARHRRKPDVNDFCAMQEREITLDSYGKMHICQCYFQNEFIVGDYLTTPLKELRKKIMNHKLCPSCKAKGIPRYSMIYSDPVTDKDTVAFANKGKYKESKPFYADDAKDEE